MLSDGSSTLVIFVCSIGIHLFLLAHQTPRAVCLQSATSRSFTTCGSTARRSLARSLALRSLVWNQISAVHAYTHTQDGRQAATTCAYFSPSKWTLDVVGIHLYGDFIPMHGISDDMTLHYNVFLNRIAM